MRETGRGEEPSWALPGGMVEEGELVTEGLVREVLEETGLHIEEIDRLAFLTQVDVRQRRRHPGLEDGYMVTVWTFEVGRWSGELAAQDPDGFVSGVELVHLADAYVRLDSGPKAESGLVPASLRGEVEPGSVHLFRRHEDARLEAVARVPSPRPA